MNCTITMRAPPSLSVIAVINQPHLKLATSFHEFNANHQSNTMVSRAPNQLPIVSQHQPPSSAAAVQ